MNVINEQVEDYINGFYKPLSKEIGDLRTLASNKKIPIIKKDTETYLISLLSIKKPLNILEIGTAVGYSSIVFASLLKNSKITTIEYKEEMKEEAQRNIDSFNLSDRINVYLGDAREIIKELDNKDGFDFVFIDAGKSHYYEYFQDALRLCNKGAIIVADNILMQGKTISNDYDPKNKYKTNINNMRKFVEYITGNDMIKSYLIPVGDGISISIIGE